LGRAYLYFGQVDQAINSQRQALIIAREVGDRWFESVWLGILGTIYLSLGQIEQSFKVFEQSLSVAREINYYLGEGVILGELGTAYFTLGQTRRAIEFYERGLAIAREINRDRLESTLLGYLGRAYHILGQFEQAIEFQEQALLISHEMSDPQLQSIQLLNLGKVLQAQGELSEAQRHYAEALALDVPMTNYQATLALAIVRLHQGDPGSNKIFSDAASLCQTLLNQTSKLYEPCYVLATALTGQVACNPCWPEETKRPKLLAPALAEYQRALDICAAPGVVQDAIRDLELIQAAGIEGLEPVFELLESALEQEVDPDKP
jgi:tetratricopeptide (TPR) repeat protein